MDTNQRSVWRQFIIIRAVSYTHLDKIKKINLFLDETDIQFIGNILKEDQKGEIDYRKIFRKELFFYDVEFKNKEEILEHMTREMQIRGLISKEGSKSVFKREEMSTTELGNMVAIPHAMSNDSEEAVVSVMILKKPILWENEKAVSYTHLQRDLFRRSRNGI